MREAATGEQMEDASDDDVASYDGVEDATARREVDQANKALAEARPVKKKRGADGSVKLQCIGADGSKAAMVAPLFSRTCAGSSPARPCLNEYMPPQIPSKRETDAV